MRSADCGDLPGVAGGGEPVMHCSADLAALHRWSAGPVMPRDKQQQPLPAVNGKLERAIDRVPSAVEVHPVKIEDPVRLDGSRPKPAIPSAV
jgi:hypothetical protein